MNRPAPIVERRLAAILCADVAGYTRLMNEDEAGTLRLLNSHRETTDRLIAQHRGRIANTAGDSILAEFPSAVDALQCALGIQERIAAVLEEIPENRRVSFRIGLHVGEAMVRDGDLFGDGVNIAARMQALAEPGSICISGSAHEYVHRVLPLAFEDRGLQAVKNLDTPIRAYAVRPPDQSPSQAIPPLFRGREIYLARRFYRLLFKALMEVLGPEGLISLDAPALSAIADAPGIDDRQLASRLAVDVRRARRAVKRLEALGLVERLAASGEREGQCFQSTAAGIELRAKLLPAVMATEDRVMAVLSDSERRTLQDLVARVIKANELKSADRKNSEAREAR